jgi:hypothetical protein
MQGMNNKQMPPSTLSLSPSIVEVPLPSVEVSPSIIKVLSPTADRRDAVTDCQKCSHRERC